MLKNASERARGFESLIFRQIHINTLMEYYFDDKAWLQTKPEDLWVFDKLILSVKMGYICGPVGVPVPCLGEYIVRPITNIPGMSKDAQFVDILDCTEHLPAGHFWCEVFKGRHLSVDYHNKQQILCVEGFKEEGSTYKFNKWEKVDDQIELPHIIKHLDYPYINCEFIDGNLIEVHLRLNPDFRHGEERKIVVWKGDDITPPPGMAFVPDRDADRIGFFV